VFGLQITVNSCLNMKLIVLLTALTAALILPTAVAQSYDDPNVERIVEQMKAEAGEFRMRVCD
jgi:hypothetical protein